MAVKYAERAFALGKRVLHGIRGAVATSREQNRKVIFVSGVQRSGTTLVLRLLDRSWSTVVFHEHFQSAYRQNSLRELSVIGRLIEGAKAPALVFKALNDSDRIHQLLETFHSSRCIWVFRHYPDVVNSILRKWPGWRNQIDQMVAEPSLGGWRGRGMQEQTLRSLRSYYRMDLNDASANALFWLSRNQLLFDQHLQNDDRLLLLKYESLVLNPEGELARIQTLTGLQFGPRIYRMVSDASIGKETEPDIDPAIRIACDEMYEALCAAWSQGSKI
jgi:hypothetical protein